MKGRLTFITLSHLSKFGQANFTAKDVQFFRQNINKVIRLQAFFRGTVTRRRLVRLLQEENMHQVYMSGMKSKVKTRKK